MADPLDFGVDLESVRDRVAALGRWTLVGDIQSATEAIEGLIPFNPPAAFFSIASETAERNRIAAGGHAQRIGVVISVLFCEKAERADAETRDLVERSRKAIMRQLVAWTPTGAEKGLDYDRYLLRRTGDGLVWGEVLMRGGYRFNL